MRAQLHGSSFHSGNWACTAARRPDCRPAGRLPRCAPRAQVSGYSGLLIAAPTVLYEIAAYVVPGLTKSERSFLAPVIFGSSILFYSG